MDVQVIKHDDGRKHVLIEEQPDSFWVGEAYTRNSPSRFPLIEVGWNTNSNPVLPLSLDESVSRGFVPQVHFEQVAKHVWRFGIHYTLKPANEVWLRRLFVNYPNLLTRLQPEAESLTFLSAFDINRPGIKAFQKRFGETGRYELCLAGQDWDRSFALTTLSVGTPIIKGVNDANTAET